VFWSQTQESEQRGRRHHAERQVVGKIEKITITRYKNIRLADGGQREEGNVGRIATVGQNRDSRWNPDDSRVREVVTEQEFPGLFAQREFRVLEDPHDLRSRVTAD
jgi:hypothetical protein